MKTLKTLFITMTPLLFWSQSQAQFLKNLADKAVTTASRTVEHKV